MYNRENNTTLTKANKMIQMNFINPETNKTSWTICDKRDAQVFVWQMDEKGFVWVSTDIL